MNEKPEPARILVVDDDPVVLDIELKRLTHWGYDVAVAPEAATALSLLAERSFDVVVSDIDMPGNPELLFVSRLAEMAPGLPVILITGNPTLESAIGAVTLGVRAYLLKPYPAQELRREIEAAVSFRRLHTSLLALYGSLAADVPSHAELGIFLKAATYYGAALASSVDDPAIARAASRMVDLEPLLAVLRDAVAVIARSKGAFRSKDLGTLRRRLETVLARFEPPSVA